MFSCSSPVHLHKFSGFKTLLHLRALLSFTRVTYMNGIRGNVCDKLKVLTAYVEGDLSASQSQAAADQGRKIHLLAPVLDLLWLLLASCEASNSCTRGIGEQSTSIHPLPLSCSFTHLQVFLSCLLPSCHKRSNSTINYGTYLQTSYSGFLKSRATTAAHHRVTFVYTADKKMLLCEIWEEENQCNFS